MNKIQKPWGNYIDFDRKDSYVIKKITVNPGESISLQYHNHRCEHWIVLSGKGTLLLQKSKKKTALNKRNITFGDYIYIEKEYQHRVFVHEYESQPLQLLEVQISSDDNCSEQDIVRVEDKYNRI